MVSSHYKSLLLWSTQCTGQDLEETLDLHAMHDNGLVAGSPLCNEKLVNHLHDSLRVGAESTGSPVSQHEVSHLAHVSSLGSYQKTSRDHCVAVVVLTHIWSCDSQFPDDEAVLAFSLQCVDDVLTMRLTVNASAVTVGPILIAHLLHTQHTHTQRKYAGIISQY